MKRKKVALYDPFLDTLGGGERHILSILKVLEEEGCDITIFWDRNLQAELEKVLNIVFKQKITFLPNIFSSGHQLQKLQTLAQFDYFFYVTDGGYFLSTARHNYVFAMVPKRDLYRMNLANRLKTTNYHFLSNSQYTQSWLARWGLQSDVLYPYLETDYVKANAISFKKENIILCVGRFFPHLHSKRFDAAISAFSTLKRQGLLKNYKLRIAGGLKNEDKEYFASLQTAARKETGIELFPNLPYKELFELYRKSRAYWHFTGFEVDTEKSPELAEHLGITPLEAMAMGAIPFCYNAGGPREIITNGENGFLFSNTKELAEKMKALDNEDTTREIIQNGKEFIRERFSYEAFSKDVKRVILGT
jgi:glycosyltransferase involved in cell wall biosynthesis